MDRPTHRLDLVGDQWLDHLGGDSRRSLHQRGEPGLAGTDTHQIDMNQHFVPLELQRRFRKPQRHPRRLQVRSLRPVTDACRSSQGTPSIAPIISLGPSDDLGHLGCLASAVTATAADGSATVSWTAPVKRWRP